MPVAFRSSSDSGNSVTVTSRATNVPAGAAVDDIAVCWLGQWQSGSTPTVTPPTGFTQKGATWSSGDGAAKNSIWWKRLTAADTGTYSFSWSGSFWTTLQCALFSGCATSGDPWDAVATPVTGTFGSVTSMSVTMSDPGGGLFWCVYNDSAGTHTPPTGFTEAADVDSGSMAWRIPAASGSQSASGASITSSSPAGAWLGALLSGTPPPPRESVDLTVVGSSAWTTSAASGATIAPSYPSGLAEGDVVYAVVHLKPGSAAVTTPTDWTLVGSAVAGSTAAQGAGTGPTEVSVLRRVVPAGGLTGSQTFSLTTSPNVAQAAMAGYRASGTNLAYEETWGMWQVPTTGTTGATNVSGTLGGGSGAGNLDLASKDHVLVVIAPTDDATSPSVTAVAATGATFGTITADPATHGSSTTGNDISTGLFRVPVTAGASTAAPVVTASLATAETMVGFAWRVRATAEVPAAAARWWPQRRGPNYRR